ncbi:GTP-binding protein Rheb isoform X3 [Poecilia formosa]|uniref:GTP-binding protein Rheb isoform X3 n=1 Tax=Poecilia formosa TaxID=48698 RepID=UPI0007BA0B81|nr:PREDICTED: GTP-binding protein Rheb homolog 1-like isoform X3 [Poecilia formosa]
MPPSKSRKIAVLVYRSVGKSSLTIQFVDSYSPTIENIFTKTMALNGQQYNLQLVDTAGQSCTTDVNGYALIYSVTSYKSFEVVQVIHEKWGTSRNPSSWWGTRTSTWRGIRTRTQSRWFCWFRTISSTWSQQVSSAVDFLRVLGCGSVWTQFKDVVWNRTWRKSTSRRTMTPTVSVSQLPVHLTEPILVLVLQGHQLRGGQSSGRVVERRLPGVFS